MEFTEEVDFSLAKTGSEIAASHRLETHFNMKIDFNGKRRMRSATS